MKTRLLILSAVTALFLTACNTASNTPSNTDGSDVQQNDAEQATQNEDSQTTEQPENDDESNEVTSPVEDENSEVTSQEPSSNVESNPVQQPEKSNVPTNSSEQNYAVQLLDGYTLTAEEPGTDIVLNPNYPNASMQLETFSKSEITYEELTQSAKESVTDISADAQYTELNFDKTMIPSDITKIDTFHVQLDNNETVSKVSYESSNHYVLLTIYDDSNQITNELLKIGLSVK